MNEAAAPMVRIDGVVFRYAGSDFVLRVPELAVTRGERLAMIGPSGSGKTTLLHLVAGIRVPAEGAVETNGVAVSGLDDAHRRDFRIRNVGLVFQQFELLRYLDQPHETQQLRSELTGLRERLGGPGVYERAAREILSELP